METAPAYDLFLSYSRRDLVAAETLAARLVHEAGLRLWMDRARLQPGASWREEIEQAMNAAAAAVIAWGPQGLGPVQRQERDLAYALRDVRPGFRVVYALLPGAPPPQGTWANVDTWVRFEGGLDEADPFARLVAALKGEAPPGSLEATLPDEPAPYRGLAAFGLGDRRFFFGRSAMIQELCERLARLPFLAVVGASGSGKTSLVQAGLLARLAAEKEPAGERVRPLVVRPGPRPLQSLAAELARLGEGGDPLAILAAADDLRQRLAAEPGRLPDLVQTLLPSGERAALVVDRLEEIYTLAESEEEVERFVAALLALARHPHRPALLLLTLRADFYARLARHPELAAEVAGRQVYVTPLSQTEVAEAVEAPTAVVGAVGEKGLAARVRDDARQHGEVVLPLLQHALDLLWRKRRGRWITWEAYDEIGQVAGALRYQADRVVGSLSGEEQAAARRLLTRLVWIEEGAATAIAGRRVSKDHLVEENALQERVLQRLADERLVQVRGGDGRATAELIHDSLPLHWERLKAWVSEDREFLLWRQRLHADLAEWERTGRDEGTLLRGAPFVEAERWADERRDDLSPEEKELVTASAALRDREKAERDRLRRWVVIGLAAGLVLALGLALLAGWQWRRAVAESQVALSRQLAALAAAEPIERLDRALLLAVEADRAANTFEAQGALLAGLTKAPPLAAFLHGRGKPAGAIAFSPDGKVFAAALEDGRIERWDVATRQPIGEPLAERSADAADELDSGTRRVTQLAFGPDGRTLAVIKGSFGESVSLWDLAADPPAAQRILKPGDLVLEIAVSPNRRWLALVGPEAVIVWDLLARRQVGELLMPIKGVFFAPDSRRLLVSRSKGGALLVTIEAPRLRAERLAEGTMVTSAAWSADGRELALGTREGAVRRYDLAASAESGPPLASGSHPVVGLSYTREGKDLVAIGQDGAITLWDRSSPAPAARLGGKLKGWIGGGGVTFSPDGRDLITAGNGSGKLEVWRLLDGREHPAREMGGGLAEARWSADGSRLVVPQKQDGFRVLTLEETGEVPPHTLGSAVARTAFSPDGETLAVSDFGGRISLWDLSEKGSLRRSLPAKWMDWPSAVWSPDGRLLAWGSGEVALWDVAAGRSLPPLASAGGERKQSPKSVVSALAFSPDGRTLASGSSGGEVRLWDMAGRTPAGPPLAGPKYSAVALAFTPDGRRLVVVSGFDSGVALWDLGARQRTELPSDEVIGRLAGTPARPVAALAGLAGADEEVALVDLDSGKLVKTLKAPAPVNDVAFHPQGDVLATVGEDGAVLLWDVASGERVGAPLAVGPSVISLSFDRTGGRLAAGSQNGSVTIWDLDRRQRLLPPLAGTPDVGTVAALSPDGTKLVTAGGDARPLLWDLDIATWPARACHIANRNLNREEWRQAFGEETPYRKTCPELPGPRE